jgi:hypothetical protein
MVDACRGADSCVAAVGRNANVGDNIIKERVMTTTENIIIKDGGTTF